MIDVNASPEVRGIVEYLTQATRRPFRVTSTFRPGARTASGALSRHGRKLAVDFAGAQPGRDSDALGGIFHAFVGVEGHLNELIYAGPQAFYNIKRGRRVGKYAQAIHHDHVHVAVDPGVILTALPRKVGPVTSERIDDTDGREDMADPVDAIVAPNGKGVWVLTRDGGIRTYDDSNQTPFHGSYFSLAEEHRNIPRTFVAIRPNDRGGYDLVASSGEVYGFP